MEENRWTCPSRCTSQRDSAGRRVFQEEERSAAWWRTGWHSKGEERNPLSEMGAVALGISRVLATNGDVNVKIVAMAYTCDGEESMAASHSADLHLSDRCESSSQACHEA